MYMRTSSRIWFILPLAAAACQQAPKADKAAVSEPQAVLTQASGHTLPLDTTACILFWIGTKPTGEHKGSFRFRDGEIFVNDSTITGGNFTINIASLRNLDLNKQPDMQQQLEEELRGANFFDAGQFPTAKFEVTEVTPYHPAASDESVLLKDATHMIRGNLTMKNATKNITFPAKIVYEKGKVKAAANFNIDRTQWGMTYRADKSLQDKLINSVVNIQFELITK